MKRILMVAALLMSGGVFADPLPIELFARQASYETVKISPTGRYLALTVPSGNQVGIATIDLDSMKLAGATGFGPGKAVADFWWVGDERLVATPAIQLGSRDFPQRTGELVGFRYDGAKVRFLIGQTAEQSVGSNLKKPEVEYLSAEVLEPMPARNRDAIISIDDLQGLGLPRRGTRVARINTMTGSRIRMGTSALDKPSVMLATREGEPVMSVARRDTGVGLIAHLRTGKGEDWRELKSLKNVRPLALSKDEQTAYVLATSDSDRSCVYAVPLDGEPPSSLLCHPTVDVSHTVFASDTGAPIAALAEPGRPEWVYAAGGHPEAVLLKKFSASFPDDQFVVPVSTSLDGRRMVLLVYGEREPGVYYLFDKAKGKIQQIVAKRAWIDPTAMARVKPVQFTASDGQTIHGYLTLPPAGSGKNMPAVVMPHGGPLGIRDRWEWDRDAQFLANRGYAVVQINFRGSGGYGSAFLSQGRKQWAGRMIDDLTDGVDHLVKQGHIDRERLCIYGGSYGGYAAMMSAVKEPDLYQCVIGYVGVYDLKAFRDRTDITNTREGLGYFQSSIAGTDEEMRRDSPITHLDRLKAPVFIVHGGEDRRVPVNQAKLLKAALEERNHPHEYYVESGEGHGFFDPEHVEELLTRMARFLDQHIGR